MAVALAATGCSSSKEKELAHEKMMANRYSLRVNGGVVYSPNGEPLSGGAMGRLSCVEAIAAWFDRVDANHDGIVDLNELLADARVQFARMDLDNDGAIYPSELLTFRSTYQGPARRTNNVGVPDSPAEVNAGEMARLKAMGYAAGIVTADDPYKKKYEAVADVSDPVMSADTNLDFKVTLDEFVAQAKDLYKRIDADHDGKVERFEMMTACPSGNAK